MSRLGFDQVGKVYGDGTHAITDFNLEVGDGEFVVFVGPSGCGKSTALRMVAGLEPVTHGRISVGERVVNHIPPKDRDIAMVFQTYALYPHMTIAENMGFALKMSKVPKSEIERRVKQAGELLGISEHLDRRPRHLSGGQRQRAAMGRAIVRDPQAFLMDEPLSNLDAKLRMQMRAEISELQGRLGVTTLYVTHDQIEAMTMGDRVAVLKLGVLQQAGKPQDLFSSPANLFVASFIGSPAMNLLEADVLREDGGLAVRFGSLTLGVGDASAEKCPSLEEYVGKRVVVGLRPDYFFRPDASVPDRQRLTTRVSLVEPLGTEVLAHLDTDARKVLTEATDPTGDGEAADERDREELTRNAKLTTKFPTQDAPDSGAHCEIAYDIERMYFFDPDSGEAL